MNLHKTIDIES